LWYNDDSCGDNCHIKNSTFCSFRRNITVSHGTDSDKYKVCPCMKVILLFWF
jgi:hypothetical protein